VLLPPTKVFQQLTTSANETVVKPRVAAAVGRKTMLKPRLAAATNTYALCIGYSRRKIPCSMAYTIAEKAIWFRHPGDNPYRTQKLISSSMSRHLSTRNILSKSMHAFLSNLAHRETNKRMWAKTYTSSFVSKVIMA